MALDGPNLGDLLGSVAAGRVQLPDFQREWKWDDERIRALIATVTLDYPLGVALTLDTGGAARFRSRPLAGTEVAPGTQAEMLLLDGQQRLTSLYQALMSTQPVLTWVQGDPTTRWYYIDIAKALDPRADRDDAIVSVPENRLIRGDFGRDIELDLSSREQECLLGLFPLNLVFDSAQTGEWHEVFAQVNPGRSKLFWQFHNEIIGRIQKFQVPLIRLPKTTSKDAVCSVFERVNTGGVTLNVFELLTASYAGEPLKATGQDADDYFNLAQYWRGVKRELADAHPVLGGVEEREETGLTSLDFLQAVSLVATFERKKAWVQAHPNASQPPAVGCKRRDLLELPLPVFLQHAPTAVEAFHWVGAFLACEHIFRERDLPYRTQLVPLAAIRMLIGDRADEPAVRAKLTRWYWCGVLGELYSGSTESRFVRDVEQLAAWILADGPEPDTVAEAFIQDTRLNTLTTRNSAAYKGIYALLLKQGAIDWANTTAPITGDSLVGQYIDVRQIFPKAWLGQQGGDLPAASSIVNKTPLSYLASTMIGNNPPSTYLPRFERESGLEDHWFDDVVSTHLIDPKLLWADDFEGFYRDRAARILALAERAMGNPAIREGQQP
ncbi:MAG TPA: DUF262 domain-containing protein [Actinospica sp.]|jgi:hypothetical protein|nr:DUF262 domain-containing protein [Actinospica sp.]